MVFSKDVLGMTILLYIFWLLISWSLDWVNLLLGFTFSLFVAIFMAPEIIRAEERPPFLARGFFFLKFVLILIREIIKANFQVVAIVLSPRLRISPQFVEVKQTLRFPVTQALWGNSITLTPGTLSIDVDDRKILIHFLTEEMVTQFPENPVGKALVEFEGRGK